MSIQLYPGLAFSPQAVLADNVGAGDAVVPVSDVSAFPPAPNLATIGGEEGAETILYAAKTETALSGGWRGSPGPGAPGSPSPGTGRPRTTTT